MISSLQLPTYPQELETWWWQKALTKWCDHGEEKILNLLRREIVEQSDRFNKKRIFDSGAYGSRDLSILAYGNFFFPRTWYAMSLCLAEAHFFRSWKKSQKGPIRILDLGSGSGASSFAVLQFLNNLNMDNPIFLNAYDYSGKSLGFLEQIHGALKRLWAKSKIQTKRLDLTTNLTKEKNQKYDLILMGYSFNEIFEGMEMEEKEKWMEDLTRLLSPNGILIIVEPANKKSCQELHSLSSRLISSQKELFLHAPYFNNHSCPLISSSSKYYSHEVRKIPITNRVQKINAPLNLEMNQVKFGFCVLGKQKPQSYPFDSTICRVVSPINKKKGTLSFIGIGGNGMEYRYEIQRRDLKNDETKILTKLERGDILKIKNGQIGKDLSLIRVPNFESLNWPFAPRWEKA